MIRKIGLYFLSLWLLFLLIIIITVDIPIYWGEDSQFIGINYLFSRNIVPFICIIALIIGAFSFYDFNHKLKGTPELAFKITEIENIDYEHLTFLTTYIIPLVCFNFDSVRYELVLLIVLIIIGIIYIRTNLYYANPTLAILGFRIYKVTGDFVRIGTRNNIVLITRDKLDKSDRVKYIKLDPNIFYAKKIKS
ncbi:anti-phage protein KwaA [Dysgonomonas alginatilytica]|nr:anti-phage protein KwaA [Dysgonomonas alginatilytica]